VSPRRPDETGSTRDDASRGRSGRLANEREFLRASIDDLERELSAGEVEAEDFAVLHARYRERLIEVETALSDQEPSSAEDVLAASSGSAPSSEVRSARRVRQRLGRRRTRLVIGIAAASCFVVAAALLAAALAGVRLPGESDTGSVSLSTAQQEQETLDRAAIVGSEGQVAEAVQLYDQVLRTDPSQPDALAYGGWLIRLAGLSAKNRVVVARGDASVAKAVKVSPGYPDAHALYGVILYEDFASPKAASAQFAAALGAGASDNLLESVAAIAANAFAAAKEPLPPRYAAAKRSAAAAAEGS